MIRKLLLATLSLCICVASYAQSTKNTGIVKGKLINTATKAPFSDLRVSIPELKTFTSTDGEGNFILSEIPFGQQTLLISGYNVQRDSVTISVGGDVTDVKEIQVKPNDMGANPENVEIPTIGTEDNSTTNTIGQQTDQEGVATQNVSGVIFASKDPFVYTMSYILGSYSVQQRGYARNSNEIQVNGIPMNDLETGNASWGQLGGLNDVFRGREVTYGLSPSEYSFGGNLGSTYFDATAANQWRETKVTYTYADRIYRNRVMITHNSGLMKNGWAYSISASARIATEGYVPGTFYNGYSYYAAVSKVIKKSQFNLTAFGAPTQRGKLAPETKEADSLAGSHYYNSNWGYQSDSGNVKRNAKVQNIFQPMFIFNWDYKPNSSTKWNTGIAYQFGKDQSSGLNYASGAYDPYPNYYRNFPSYLLNSIPPDPVQAAQLGKLLASNPGRTMQIDWQKMYFDNSRNDSVVYNADGITGNTVRGKQALYWLGNYVNDLHKWTFNTTVQHSVDEHITLDGGLKFIHQENEYYDQVTDLLGADYVLDENQFVPNQYSSINSLYQNNLNQPNHVAYVGDKFGSDYTMKLNNGLIWGQSVFNYDKVDFFFAANAGFTSFMRDGLWKNGTFPDNSYGNSSTNSFLTYGIKGGVTYKIDSRNLLFVNAAYSALPPTPDNTYIAPTLRDLTASSPTVSTSQTVEAGYLLQSPILNARIVGYVTDDQNQTIIKHFYDDDPSVATYVDYLMQKVNTRSIGTEIMLDYRVLPVLHIIGVASIGQAFYTNRPTVSSYRDDDTSRTAFKSQTFIKNYYLAVGPQSAYTVGFNYRPNRTWYVDLNFNYVDRNYVDINPNRRTAAAAEGVIPGSPLWHEIFDQEELPSAFTVDLRAGINIDLKKHNILKKLHRPVLTLSGNINNLLNNTNIINVGFEQMRYNYSNNNPKEFPNEYIYGYGINFFVQAALRF